MVSNIDELNQYDRIYTDSELDKILTEYFDIMDIDEDQKEKRKELAKDFRNAMLFLFALAYIAYENDYFSYEYLLIQFRTQYADVLLDHIKNDPYIERYFQKVTEDLVQTTFDHFNPEGKDYWTSDERAIIVGENEANSVLNYSELQDAIEAGYEFKTWKTERDNKVRQSHKEKENVTIPIDEYFQFDDCEMLMPHDSENGSPEQLVNCRCTCKYS